MSDFVFDISDDKETFTLECLDNLKRPEESQMRVTVESLSNKDVDQIGRIAMKKAGPKPSGKGDKYNKWYEKYLDIYLEETFNKKIIDIENIIFKINDENKEIKSIYELYTMKSKVANTIVAEITEIVRKFEEVPEKN